MINNKNTIIFDFDGTLVDTMQVFADVASCLMSENYNIEKEEARKLYFETSGLPFHHQLESIFPKHKLNSKLASVYETQKLDATSNVLIEDEVMDVLCILKDSDYNIVVSSNNFQYNIDNYINDNDLRHIFDLALGFKESFGKGQEHFSHIQDELGIELEEAIFVGDSINDAKLAAENNIDFIGKLGTFSKEDFQKFDKNIRTINEIKNLLN